MKPNFLYTYYAQVILMVFIVVNHLVEIYLARRQLATLRKHADSVPDEFISALSLEDHQKAIRYGSARLNLTQIKLVWEAALLMYWFPFRGAEKLYLALPGEGIHREVLFLLAFTFIQTLINLPWSLYSTFILEEKFGFNRVTMKLFITDRLKGMTLGLVIGVPVLYAIFGIFFSLGQYWWMVSFAFITIFQFVLLWLYPTFIAPLFNKFKELESEDLKKDIEGLVGNAGFQSKGVFVMDASKRSSHGNAYFTGFGKNKRVVFFDTLLKDLEKSEILAILAHELGHLKLKHIPKSLIVSILLSFVGFFLMGQMTQEQWFYSGNFVRVMSPAVLLLIFTQVIPLYSFWTTPVSSWISRKREFEADHYAAHEINASYLISGLLKLYQHNASPVVTDKIYSTFYHSHPPALERIKKLKSLEGLARQ
jgi:STE24 endopeptidase